MRVGVIGLGRIGVGHAGHLLRHPDVDGLVLVGRDAGRLEAAEARVRAGVGDAAAHTRIERSTDVDAALRGLDAVVVTTITSTHPDLVRRAVAARVPVLVEKPLALDLDVLEPLVDELEAQDVPVAVAFHRRYDPAYRRLRERVASGSLGRLRVLRSTGHDRPQLDPGYIPVSGGIWRDLLIHDFDAIPWIAGEPVVRVQAVGAVVEEPAYAAHGDVDTAGALLTLASGAIAFASGVRRNGAGHDARLEVFGTDDTAAAGLDDRTPVTSTEAGTSPPAAVHADFAERFAPAFAAEIDHFVRLAQARAANRTPPRDGVRALRLAIAAERSVREGAAIDVLEDGRIAPSSGVPTVP